VIKIISNYLSINYFDIKYWESKLIYLINLLNPITIKMKKRVVVAMSGGVDSSIAAYLLKEQGFEIIGLFMSLGACLEKLAPKRKACCSVYDANDARSVADLLDIKFSVLDFKPEFEKLINYFCSEYDAGRTPNPCIKCNQHLKFGKLMEYADKLDADFIATGHYARITAEEKHYLLKKGLDKTKDQSYVLFPLTQQQLSRILFPLGELTKSEVRQLAQKIDLPVKDKLESQEICFVAGNDYRTLIKERLPNRLKEGNVKDTNGRVIGQHQGYQLFTIGQRHGLRIALGKPAYVVKIIPETNTVVLGSKEDVYKTTFLVDEVNWISLFDDAIKPTKTLVARGDPDVSQQTSPMAESAFGDRLRREAEVKIRYLHKQAKAKIDILNNNQVEVNFYQPQPAITPGQAAVFYQDDTVLGGGWIKEVLK
jgi:tRNA-specific 2-thiouridylase